MMCFQLIPHKQQTPKLKKFDLLVFKPVQRQHVDQLRAPREPLPAAGLARAELQAGQHGARHQGAVAQPPQGGAAPQGKVQQDICRLKVLFILVV